MYTPNDMLNNRHDDNILAMMVFRGRGISKSRMVMTFTMSRGGGWIATQRSQCIGMNEHHRHAQAPRHSGRIAKG